MVDKFGARMTGSPSLEKAIDYVVDEMKAAGLSNVHTQDVVVPNWVRGYENAMMLSPSKQHLPVLGMGTTIGTAPGGITANVVAVESFHEFEQVYHFPEIRYCNRRNTTKFKMTCREQINATDLQTAANPRMTVRDCRVGWT